MITHLNAQHVLKCFKRLRTWHLFHYIFPIATWKLFSGLWLEIIVRYRKLCSTYGLSIDLLRQRRCSSQNNCWRNCFWWFYFLHIWHTTPSCLKLGQPWKLDWLIEYFFFKCIHFIRCKHRKQIFANNWNIYIHGEMTKIIVWSEGRRRVAQRAWHQKCS